jgi:site-specific recombinase XerD
MAATKAAKDPFFDYFHQYFTEYLPGARNCSEGTIETYRSAFRLLEEFCDTHTARPFSKMVMDALGHDTVVSFPAWLKDMRGNGPATLAVRLAAIKSFLGFCSARDPLYTAQYQSVCLIPTPKIPDRGMAFLPKDGIKALLAQPDASKPKGLRDLAFMALMYDAAARMSEMLNLRMSDIRIEDGIVCLWLTGKGNKRRMVPIEDNVANILLRYLKEAHPNATYGSTDLLFYTVIHNKRCQMSDDCARLFIKKYAAKAREVSDDVPEKMHSHLLRRSRAMHLYQSGCDLIIIRDFLGHTSLAVTSIYARADARMLKEAIERVTPVGEGEAAEWLKEGIAAQLESHLKKRRES